MISAGAKDNWRLPRACSHDSAVHHVYAPRRRRIWAFGVAVASYPAWQFASKAPGVALTSTSATAPGANENVTSTSQLWELRRRTVTIASAVVSAIESEAALGLAPRNYNWNASTYQNYASPRPPELTEVGAAIAHWEHIDWKYHGFYVPSRQRLQEAICDALVLDAKTRAGAHGTSASTIFTAGAIGAGKSFTIRWAADSGLLPVLSRSVYVDPDVIASALPEWREYKRRINTDILATAHAMCLREAGLISELTIWAALRSELPLCVDSSLRNGEWHRQLFQSIRGAYPHRKLVLLHTDAGDNPHDELHMRVRMRERRSGRSVPTDLVDRSQAEVRYAVQMVRHILDVYVLISNSGNGSPRIGRLCNRQRCRDFTDSAEGQASAKVALTAEGVN